MSNRTDEELIKIVTVDREGYQPQAVTAAYEEIKQRNLPFTKIETITEELKSGIEEKNRRTGTQWLAALANALNPVQKEMPATGRIIKLISIFLWATFLYELYDKLSVYGFAFFTGDYEWRFGIMFLIPLIYLPTAGSLFWFRKKSGWMLAASYFSYMSAGAIPMFIITFIHEPSGIPSLDALFTAVSPVVWVGRLLFFSGLTWCLCRKNIRTIYRIDLKKMLTALGLGTGVVLLITFGARLL
ncbi:MAG: hypothetical protein LBV47_09915 [Bacteroidales bacterium]|nr:hypothetical protein [Bacteroidales bacterium]